ncbi:hypothetical protein EMIHUDRAFT_206936 [Emiliania huxleyi CCMP1516]|uniref:Uncharacterized protein n=2 Tax=Emiliania huxleyi TaxID=2903 RepID=A0A0D3JKA3_EMIH1|nr:hypothetical protein EMIHUDRAFT_206936 [Emiliania huxleyi CCMP1516]EOD23938.1 hypothetical protein EMIHUDRAFT_206936 [Emiliania huxleyi CCMP1516]|eukprot:XP_005776367.1 hypothetical protein EMIHUDRAFT_206936 [Emiliania huxleyi CCMP1516]
MTKQATDDGEQGTGDDPDSAIAPAGDGAESDPADEHVDATTGESTSEGDVDMDERPISQRLVRRCRDESKPPPSYSGHDGEPTRNRHSKKKITPKAECTRRHCQGTAARGAGHTRKRKFW